MMNDPIREDEKYWGPVLRTADRMRIEGCINALTREGLSLALQCQSEALLDHYVRLMLTRLREATAMHQVDVYFPANTESLLDRFNAVLSDQSLGDATRNPSDELPVRVWVVHDAQKVPEAEMQLLARLIQNFPGARIRALLLFHGGQADPDTLASFGRKLLRWEIDLPTPEQAADALESAAGEGRQAPMTQLLRRIGRLPQETTSLSLGQEAELERKEANWRSMDRSPNELASSTQLFSRFREALQGIQHVKANWSAARSPASKKLIGGAVLALGLSVLLMVWLQPKSFSPARSPAPVPAPVTPEVAPEDKKSNPAQKQGRVGVVRSPETSRS